MRMHRIMIKTAGTVVGRVWRECNMFRSSDYFITNSLVFMLGAKHSGITTS